MTQLQRRSFATPKMIGLTVAALLIALAVGSLVGSSQLLIVTAMLAMPPLVLIVLRQYHLFVLMIPFAALLVPFSLPTGTASRLSIVMLLVMLLTGIWVLMAISKRKTWIHASPLNAPLLCFILVCCLALVWSIVFRDPLLIRQERFIFVQLGALAAMVLSPVASLLIATFLHSSRQLVWVATLFLAVGAVFLFCRYFEYNEERIINVRGMFPLWFGAICYALFIAQPRLNPIWRIALGVALLLHLYDVAYVGITWLSGWFPLVVAICAITLFYSRKWFVVLMLVLGLFVFSIRGYLYQTIFVHSEEEGDFQRLSYVQRGLTLLQNHVVFGTGPAGYALYYQSYHPDHAASSHNGYLDLVAQVGLVGALCWVWLVVAGIREARVVLQRAPPGIYRTFGLACSGGLIGALVSMALGDWVLPFAYNQGLQGYGYTVLSWVFLGVLMFIRRQVAPMPERSQHYKRSRDIRHAA